jgi:hypothetical protein
MTPQDTTNGRFDAISRLGNSDRNRLSETSNTLRRSLIGAPLNGSGIGGRSSSDDINDLYDQRYDDTTTFVVSVVSVDAS